MHITNTEFAGAPKGSFDGATVEEVAAPIAGMSTHAFYRGIRNGHIPPGIYWRLGRSIRVSRSRLADWLAQGGTASQNAA